MAVPTITNITMTSVNNQYSMTIPKGISNITLQLRGTSAILRFAFASGLVNTASPAGPYGTVNPGKAFSFPLVNPDLASAADITLYVASDTGSQVCEVITS